MTELLSCMRFIFKILPDSARRLSIPVTGLFISNIISLLIPLISIRLIDSIHNSNAVSLRWALFFLTGWILALSFVVFLEYIQNLLFRKYGNTVIMYVYQAIINRCLNNSYQIWMYIDSRENTEKIKRNLEDLLPLVSGAPFILIRHLLVTFVTVIILIQINWLLTLAVSFLIPMYFLSFLLYNNQLKSSYWIYRRSGEKFLRNLIEFTQSVPILNILCSVPQAKNALNYQYINVINTQYEYYKIMNKRRTFFRFLSAIVPVYLVSIAYIFIRLNMATVGEIFGFWGLFSMLNASMNGFAAQYTGMLKALTVFNRIKKNLHPLGKAKSQKIKISGITKIGVSGLSFAYRKKINRNISIPDFEIHQGGIMQITGATGVGKTTLLRIMLGLLPVKYGSVTVNDISRHIIEDGSFFDQVGYVEQNGYLFSRSVQENILMGRTFDSDKWCKTVQLSGLGEVIHNLPQKEESQIGENGVFLSGGQRQKILFARALYHQPAWLFMDEPFTGIDLIGKGEIENLILALNDRITLILVTHQPSTHFRNSQIIRLQK